MYRFCPRNSPGSSVRSTRVPRIEPAGRSLTCVTPSPCHGSPPEPRVVAARPSLSLGVVLRLVLPKGSLEKATLELFEAADLHVVRSSSVDYTATIDDPRIDRGAHPAPAGDPGVRRRGPVRRRHHRSRLGRGDRRATSSPSASCATPRRPSNPISMVVAVAGDSPVTHVSRARRRRAGLVGVPASSPGATSPPRASTPTCAFSYGASEAKIPDIADCVVEITETGRALRAAGLKVIDTILTSYTEVIANKAACARPRQAPRDGAS